MLDVNADDKIVPQVPIDVTSDDIPIESLHNKAVIGVVLSLFVLTLVTVISTLDFKTYLSSANEVDSSNVIAPTLTSIPSPTIGSRITIHPCPSRLPSLSPYITKKPSPTPIPSGPQIPTMTPIPSGAQFPTVTPTPSSVRFPTIRQISPSGSVSPKPVTPTNPPRGRPIELPVSPTPCPY